MLKVKGVGILDSVERAVRAQGEGPAQKALLSLQRRRSGVLALIQRLLDQEYERQLDEQIENPAPDVVRHVVTKLLEGVAGAGAKADETVDDVLEGLEKQGYRLTDPFFTLERLAEKLNVGLRMREIRPKDRNAGEQEMWGEAERLRAYTSLVLKAPSVMKADAVVARARAENESMTRSDGRMKKVPLILDEDVYIVQELRNLLWPA